MIVLKSMDAQPQFDDVDGFAHVFDSSELEDEWKIRLSRELGVAARERAKHDGITLTELTRKALDHGHRPPWTKTEEHRRSRTARRRMENQTPLCHRQDGTGARVRGRHILEFARAACDQRISTSTGY